MVLEAGAAHGYGNMLAHLRTAWARQLAKGGLEDETAINHVGGDCYPFAMQDDLLENGEWDETGKRYC